MLTILRSGLLGIEGTASQLYGDWRPACLSVDFL